MVHKNYVLGKLLRFECWGYKEVDYEFQHKFLFAEQSFWTRIQVISLNLVMTGQQAWLIFLTSDHTILSYTQLRDCTWKTSAVRGREGFFRCERPHFLLKQTSIFFGQKGTGVNFSPFWATLLWTGPNWLYETHPHLSPDFHGWNNSIRAEKRILWPNKI